MFCSRCFWLISIFTVFGCRQTAGVFDSGVTVASPAQSLPSTDPLNERQVLAWLGWQQSLASAHRANDGGDSLLARVKREDASREAAGLTEAEADAVETLVAAAAMRRAARVAANADALREVREGLGRLGPEQRMKAEAILGAAPATVSSDVASLERQFGAAAVNAVQSHEKELLDIWESALSW